MKATRVVTVATFSCAAVAALLVGMVPSASAHTFLRNYIQHRAVITVGPTNIDLALELTFYENGSMKERARMDTNHDGRVSKAEIQVYLRAKASAFERGLMVTVDGKPMELAPLYDATLDLIGDARVGPHAHVLRLYYFARTPPSLAPGCVLTFRDGLWAGTGALRSVEINGTGGFSEVPDREPGVWRARCQAVPTKSDGAIPIPARSQ